MPPESNLQLIYGLGVIPATLVGSAELAPGLKLVDPLLTLISYQFLHGGLAHLGGNMLYLWVFGDNVEDAMGHGRFLVFYTWRRTACGKEWSAPAVPSPVSWAPT